MIVGRQMEMQLGSSSSSSGSIDGKFKRVEAKAYAKVDAKPPEIRSGCVPVMVSITAVSGATEEQRAPVDLVVVLHVREGCNVPKNWKELIVEAMDTIVAKLDGRDSLTVIPSKRPTISKTSLTRDLESAESILYGRKDEDKKIRTGCIIVISNSNDNIDSLVSWRLRSVHAFGFRDAQNARTMHSISSSRNCTYAILDDVHGHLTHSFFDTISRIITSAVAAIPVEIKLMCEQMVVLHSIGTPGVSYYLSYDNKSAIMWPNAHLAGMTTNIIVYLGGVNHSTKDANLPQLFTVHVKYGNVLDKVDVQLVQEGSDGSRELAAEIVRLEAVKIIAGITTEDKYDWEQLPEAADSLCEQWTSSLEDSKCGREARAAGLISRLDGEMQEMEVRLYNNYYWLEYMLSWQSHQQCQLPLPQPFMHNQSTSDPLLQLRILAKAEGKITEHQEGLPIMVRVMASDAGLAKVKRASIDLVLVIDASDPDKEREMKSRKRLHLLNKARVMEEEHNMAKNVVVKLKESLNTIIEVMKTTGKQLLINAKEMELEKDVNKVMKNTEERLGLLTKAKTMEEEHNKAKNMVVELEESLKPLIKAKEEEENEGMSIKRRIAQKRQEMNNMANEMNRLRYQAMKLEKDVDKVMKNMEERLGLLIESREMEEDSNKAKNMVAELLESMKLLIKDTENEWMDVEGKITQKRQAMDRMSIEMKGLRYQATELEKDVDRLGLLTKAIELVMEKLSVMDRLAIVPVQSCVTEPATGLFEMSKQGRIETSNKVEKLSMTLTDNKAAQVLRRDKRPRYCKWREQPKEAMRIIRNCLHSAPRSSSSTRSPRSAKSEDTASMTAHSTDVGGSTSTLQKALMCAMKILDDNNDEGRKDRLGSIIVISDNDDDSICMETLRLNYMVHAFGFYGMHSTRALYHIASSSNGIYNIINDDRNQITEAFTSCINKMTSTISVDTKVEIMCNPLSNVALSTIESAQFRYSIGKDRKSCSVLVGALSAGTVKNFIIYVDNVREEDYDNLSKYFTVRVKWMHTGNRMDELEGQVVVVRDGIDGYKEVVENIAHVEAVKIASDITDPNHSKMVMADMLQQMCIKCPDFKRSAGYDRLIWLSSLMQNMEANHHMEITDPNDYRNMVAEKLSYILSWLSYQRSYCWINII